MKRQRRQFLAGLQWLLIVCLPFFASGCVPPDLPVGAPRLGPSKLAPDGYFTAGGARLATRIWAPPHPRAVIVGLHGMNDYSKTFDMIGPWLYNRGIALYAYDQRGFGRNAHAGLWPGGDQLVADADDFIALVRARYPRTPLYVMGVSMGAAVALAYDAEQRPAPIDGMILVSPAVWGWSTLNPLYKLTLRLTAELAPSKTFTGESLNIWPSDNIMMLRSNYHDPYMLKATRADSIYGLVTLMDRAFKDADRASGPILVLYGDRDQIIPKRPVEELVAKLDGKAETIRYPNGYHMLLRDLQAEIVWRDIAAWVGGGRLAARDPDTQQRISDGP